MARPLPLRLGRVESGKSCEGSGVSDPVISDESALKALRAPLQFGVGAIAGLLSGVLAVGVAQLLAVFIHEGATPIIAVGQSAIDLAPTWLKTWAVATFGTADKPVLLGGITVVLVLLAVVLGVFGLRRRVIGFIGMAVLGVAGALAALSRPTASIVWAVPPIIGALVGAGAFAWLVRLAPKAPAAGASEGAGASGAAPSMAVEMPGPPGFDRRSFFRAAAVVGIGAVAAGGLGRSLLKRSAVDASRAGIKVPTPLAGVSPLPQVEALSVPGLSPFITPNADFFRIDTALFVPQLAAEDWKLRIHGMVDREIELDYAALVQREMVERDITLACVSNEVGGNYIGNARWVGTLLKPLLEEAGVQAGASQMVTRSVDGMTLGTPTDVAMDGRDALLAVAMNGEPLPLPHGFPVRMVIPGLYGYNSAMKWLVDIELTTFDAYDAYWVERGWAAVAPIKTESRIDTPKPSTRVKAGRVAIAGVAWAQHRGISKVEVQVDQDEWLEATLADEDTIDTWRQWLVEWQATPGVHQLTVRATDAEGATQTTDVAPPFPDGATGHHQITVTVN